ncbi:MAG: hypothetical protein K4571_17835 [Deltaproteobacteria bacterium]
MTDQDTLEGQTQNRRVTIQDYPEQKRTRGAVRSAARRINGCFNTPGNLFSRVCPRGRIM